MDTFEGRNRLAYWQTYHRSPPRLFVAPEGRLRALAETETREAERQALDVCLERELVLHTERKP